ncbi:MAG: pyridoxamine 5'-phosphate oxidase family protein [Actinomycetota bacterium]|nr:pyridoxamine 5'-phosphate oxidase family protein [Actinomycetota bacterium]
MPDSRFDARFSRPGAGPTPWAEVASVLARAELYWLTTVRADARPHVTPLIGAWLDDAAWFTTGLEEQKSRNLAYSPQVALTTGVNTWARGVDVVVEGTAVRATDRPTLQRLADSIRDKYGADWDFHVAGDALSEGDHPSALYRVAPTKVIAFAKDPHAQTTFGFS